MPWVSLFIDNGECMLEKWRGNEVGEKRSGRKKKVALVMCMELNGAVDAPRRGPAAGTASRRDRWGKEGVLITSTDDP